MVGACCRLTLLLLRRIFPLLTATNDCTATAVRVQHGHTSATRHTSQLHPATTTTTTNATRPEGPSFDTTILPSPLPIPAAHFRGSRFSFNFFDRLFLIRYHITESMRVKARSQIKARFPMPTAIGLDDDSVMNDDNSVESTLSLTSC